MTHREIAKEKRKWCEIKGSVGVLFGDGSSMMEAREMIMQKRLLFFFYGVSSVILFGGERMG